MLAGRYPFRAGDVIRVSGRASVTTKTELFGRVQYEDGSKDRFEVLITHAGDRANQLFRTPDQFLQNGFVEALTVDTGIIKRGEYYMMVAVERLQHHYPIAASYIGVPHSPLGFFEDPLGGKGLMSWRTAIDDVTPASVTVVMAATGAFRRIYGFVWYYNCAAEVANRLLRVFIRRPGTSVPTGFAIGGEVNLPHSDNLSLQTGEEGILYSYKNRGGDGFSSRNDNGTVTVESPTTTPQIWPVDVPQDDLFHLRFNITDAHADDRHTILVLQEEWLSP